MKKNCFYFVVFICLACQLVSCNDQEKQLFAENGNDQKDENGFYSISTRSLSANEPSISNPTLHDDWENVETIKLNGGGEIDGPWIVKAGNSINIPEDYRIDIKKEDGWVMLSHTILNQSSLEPNYIILYNPSRGLIKGFYFNRQPIKNQSFMWVMESNSPTSILPSNKLVQGSLNSLGSYVTSSNLNKDSQFDFGQLNYGWNAFSFELSYGTNVNAPIMTIRGYHNESTSIDLSGTFAGEAIIPIPSESSGVESIVSSLEQFIGGASSLILPLKPVNAIISMMSSIMGQTSLFKSKTQVTNIRATISGDIDLDGSSFTMFGGSVPILGDLDIKNLNNGGELGLWNLPENPIIEYNRCFETEPPYDENMMTYYGCALDYNAISNIVINPLIINQISSYSVAYSFFTQAQSPYLECNNYVVNYYYPTDFYFYILAKNINTPNYVHAYDTNSMSDFSKVLDPILVNLTVTFSYEDGSSFISSRVFKPTFKCIDNRTEFVNSITSGGVKINWLHGTPKPKRD